MNKDRRREKEAIYILASESICSDDQWSNCLGSWNGFKKVDNKGCLNAGQICE